MLDNFGLSMWEFLQISVKLNCVHFGPGSWLAGAPVHSHVKLKQNLTAQCHHHPA